MRFLKITRSLRIFSPVKLWFSQLCSRKDVILAAFQKPSYLVFTFHSLENRNTIALQGLAHSFRVIIRGVIHPGRVQGRAGGRTLRIKAVVMPHYIVLPTRENRDKVSITWNGSSACLQKLNIFTFSSETIGQTLRHTKKMLRNKIVRFKKVYKSYFDHFLIGIIVFLINMKNAIK